MEVDLREAEARLLAGDHAWLLERRQAIADELAADEGVNVLQPLLDRLVGYALAQTGAVEDSVDAFERSAQGARDRGADHDLAMALQGLARMARIRGEDPVPYERESGEICERLGIIAVLTFPDPRLEIAEGRPEGRPSDLFVFRVVYLFLTMFGSPPPRNVSVTS